MADLQHLRRFRDALAQEPGHAGAAIALAGLLVARGDLDEAERLLRPFPADAEAEEILSFARNRIVGLHRYRILSAAACWYDVEPDERFIVEKLGAASWVMSGFTAHGFKFGPLLGLALARAMGDAALAPGLARWASGEGPPSAGLLDDLLQEHAV